MVNMVKRRPLGKWRFVWLAGAALLAVCVFIALRKGETAMGESTAVGEQPRKLEKAERVVAVKGGGYFPVLIRLQSGTLAAVVRGGGPHLGVGGRLDIITSRDGGKSWSAPRPIVYMPPDSRNPAFGQAADGGLLCAFSVTGPYPGGKWDGFESAHYTVWVTVSSDEGATWMPPQSVNIAPLQYASPYGKIVRLADETLLMAVYGWYLPEQRGGTLPPDKRGWFSYVFRSKDNGKTWGEPTLIAQGYNETALCVLPEDKVLAVMRSEETKIAQLFQTLSSDGGRTWSTPQPVLGKGRYPAPADVVRLMSGRLLLTFGRRIKPFGVEAVLSGKEVGQWDWETNVLLEWNAANRDCSYPQFGPVG